jgi:hypothetical protein
MDQSTSAWQFCAHLENCTWEDHHRDLQFDVPAGAELVSVAWRKFMEVKDAVKIAKDYVSDVFAEEQISNLGLDETEYDQDTGRWLITVGFSRPWNTPRTRAQELLENLGAVTSLRRSYKVIVISDDGKVLSMKNRPKIEAAE